MKTNLSYSTMNAVINEPHVWLCKQMGLKTYQTNAMAEGKAAHRIIQDHVSGVKINEALAKKNLPTFSIVEEKEWDDRLKTTFEINDKYSFHGWLDGKEPERGDLLEIKTGKSWSVGEFARLVQWKLYAVGEPKYKKIYFVNAPRDPEIWMPETIKIFAQDLTPEHAKAAQDFITKAIDIIEHIKEQTLNIPYKSRYCYYIDCPFCESIQ